MDTNQTAPEKKRRTRRIPEMIAELILEAERTKKAADIFRRGGISPARFARWRNKFKEVGIAAMCEMKRGPKAKNPDLNAALRENKRLTTARCEASIELLLLKKRELGLRGSLKGLHL